MEEVIRKKIEFEKMQEQQHIIDQMLQRREQEMNQIGEEKKRKDISNAALLEKALERADVL